MWEVYEAVGQLLGLRLLPEDLSFLQISLRALVVFGAAIAMVRLGDKRFLARMAPFDVILGFILASMLARLVNGSAAFFPSLGAGFVLVGLHRLAGFLAMHWHWFSILIKGHSELLIQDGKVLGRAMRKHHLSEDDLLEELRMEGGVDSPAAVQTATIERSGKISVIKAQP